MKTIEKWSKVHDDAVVIEEFLDFLSSKGIQLAKYEGDYGSLMIAHLQTRQELIYNFFGIDGKKLEAQRRELLKCVRVKQDE